MNHRCAAVICRVLGGRDLYALKKRCTFKHEKPPQGASLGVIDGMGLPECSDCVFRFSIGHTSYCDNQEIMQTLQSRSRKACPGQSR